MGSYIFINLIILISLVSVTAQRSSSRNVTLNSSIVADGDASPTWTSPSGQFAFGFRKVAGGGFLVAIWFDQLPEKTIVWSANRDNPVPSGSKVQLSAQGVLELTDQRGQRIWDANSPGRSGTVGYGAMLDTGNFVLATTGSTILWQSFDAPTDTLLPGQTLNIDDVLVSSFSETNYSRGRFMFATDGNLGLYTRDFPWNNRIYPYWLRDPPARPLIFNQSGIVHRAAQNQTIFGSPLGVGDVPTESFFQRLTLEFDGILRQYVYPKSGNWTGGRPMAWSVHEFIPENVCLGVISGGNGGGICGFNSLCSFESGNARTICECPKGYALVDPADRMSGCRPDFALQSCDPQSQSQGAQDFELIESMNTNFPYSDYRAFEPVDEDLCRQDCLADCFCALAIYNQGRCWKKQLPLINGRTDPSISGKAFVKIRKNGTFAKPPDSKIIRGPSQSQSRSIFITGSVMLGASVLLFLLTAFFYFNNTRSNTIPAVTTLPVGMTSIGRFSFNELQQVTQGFQHELGRGACSRVYRGALKDTGKVVAVKKLDKIAQESNYEFLAEVSSISRTNHKNLVQLLGYCDEGQHRILVYEFMAKGSLANFLFENSLRPNWYTRVQIAFAIARGLCYLHEECTTPIIHCDIKPQNVLLDDSYTPRIADFGLAKLLSADQTRTNTAIRGTRGYVAPEWFRNMAITVKVDVYSFGILLLELLCCRRHYEEGVEDEGKEILADWAYDCYQQGEVYVLVREDDEAKREVRMLERFVATAIWCIQEDPTLRPHMKRVLHMLEGSIEVPVPPNPSTFKF